MLRLSVVALLLALSIPLLADEPGPRYIDLRTPNGLEDLRRDNPAHFEKIRQILMGLEEKPERVEGDWLQVNFAVSDVALDGAVIKTSNPPKQLLSFRLEETRYTMYLVRRDMRAEIHPLR